MDVSVWKITKEIKCVLLKDVMVCNSTLCIHGSSIECVQCVKRNCNDNMHMYMYTHFKRVYPSTFFNTVQQSTDSLLSSYNWNNEPQQIWTLQMYSNCRFRNAVYPSCHVHVDCQYTCTYLTMHFNCTRMKTLHQNDKGSTNQ